MKDEASETKHLQSREAFPLASVEISKSICDIKNIDGFGFSVAPKMEQARVLRVLADRIEREGAVLQAVTFEEMTDVADFRMFRYSVRFAERAIKSDER